jgi:hypothetical protein
LALTMCKVRTRSPDLLITAARAINAPRGSRLHCCNRS